MPEQFKTAEISCQEVWHELVNYMEADLTEEMRARIDQHLTGCDHCTAIYDGSRNVVQLVGKKDAIELPHGLSARLYRRLREHLR